LKIGILTIGNELTTGRIQDTNSAFIAASVNALGWQVTIAMAVGDDDEAIKKALDYILALSDAVIVTGGLGPTADDMTTAAIAKAYNLDLYTDEDVLNEIKSRFERYRIEWTSNNAKQAMFPTGARPIYNPTGTAWGFALKAAGRLIAVIPGVPSEVKRMFPEEVLPLLKELQPGSREFVLSRTIKLFGLSEAKVDQTVTELKLRIPGISIGFYPRFPENHIVLTSRGSSEESVRKNLAEAERRVTEALRKYIFAYDNETLDGLVASLLTKKKRTLAVAESCTGGLIADRLTNIPGSSLFLERGVITYSNESKIQLLGVPAETIEAFGAVSEEVALLMAEGVRKRAGTDIGIAVTGIAGPAGGTEGKPVGTVYIALADGTKSFSRLFHFRWERRRVKEISAQWALEILRRYLMENGNDGR
jgi:nicotinamide-nucleotide amidase